MTSASAGASASPRPFSPIGSAPGARVKLYLQKAHAFALPADPRTPIIMIGPGTGIAPFRSFLWHRQAAEAPGKAWLFFGHQREATDFFYRDELAALPARRGADEAFDGLVARWCAEGLRAGPPA